MSIKQGDKVKVDGRESVVTSSWGQGRHKAYALEDGRTILDLTAEQLVEEAKPKTRKMNSIGMKLNEDDLKD